MAKISIRREPQPLIPRDPTAPLMGEYSPASATSSSPTMTTMPARIPRPEDSRQIYNPNAVGGRYTNVGRPATGGDPDAVQARIAQNQWRDYRKYFSPLIDDLVGEVDSRRLVDSTTEQLQNLDDRVHSRSLREQSRGLGNLTPAQKAALDRQRAFGLAEQKTSAINTARSDQRSLNQATRGNILNLAMGIGADGSTGLGQAANMASGREQAYQNAKAQQSATNTQALGSLATLAILGI